MTTPRGDDAGATPMDADDRPPAAAAAAPPAASAPAATLDDATPGARATAPTADLPPGDDKRAPTSSDPRPTTSGAASLRSGMETGDESDDEDFDPNARSPGDDGSDDDGTTPEKDDDDSDDDDDDDSDSDAEDSDAEARRALLATLPHRDAPTPAGSEGGGGGGGGASAAETEDLVDSDEEDTDSDDDSSSDDDLESVSLVPEDSNALDASVSARRGARDDDDDETADDADGGVTASAGATPCTSAVARAAFSGVGEEVTSPGAGAAQSLKRPHSSARDDSDGETSDTGMIAKRTRAHVNLHDVDVDYLEKMMPLPADEDAYQFFDDDEEYANFLSAISLDFNVPAPGEGGGGDDGDDEHDEDDDDDDDDDYALVDPKAARVERRLKSLNELQNLPPAQRRTKHRKNEPYVYKPKSERPQYKERPIYSTVRTRRMLRVAAEQRRVAAVAAAAGAASLPRGVSGGDFSPSQIGALHGMVHDHVQLLLQTFARTAWNPAPEMQQVARQTLDNINAMVYLTTSRLQAKSQRKDPPHAASCFRAPPSAGTDSAPWWPKPPGQNVYTVLDVAPLRGAQRFVMDVMRGGQRWPVPAGPAIAPPPSAAGLDAEAGKAAAASAEHAFARLSELFRPHGEGADPRTAATDWSKEDGVRCRRKPPPHEMVPFYVRIPRVIVDASRVLASCANPRLLPRVPDLKQTLNPEKLAWLPSEDALLAQGIEQYGLEWEKIHRQLLPTKGVKAIVQRQKNLCSTARSKGPNAVKAAKQKVLQPLMANEIATIQEALFRMGARQGSEDWESICARFLPHRHPSCLERLWREAHPDPPPAAGTAHPSLSRAAINMIHPSFHTAATVDAHRSVPRTPRVAEPTAPGGGGGGSGGGSGANAASVGFHPSLFGAGVLGSGGGGGGGGGGSPTAVVVHPPPQQQQQRAQQLHQPHQNDAHPLPQPPRGPLASLLFNEDSTLGSFPPGFDVVRHANGAHGGQIGASPARATASASDVALTRLLLGGDETQDAREAAALAAGVPFPLLAPPAPAPTNPKNPNPNQTNPTSTTHNAFATFESEDVMDSDDDDDDGGGGRNPNKTSAKPAAAARAEREVIDESDEEEPSPNKAEREEIASSDDDDDADVERDALEDSDDEEMATAMADGDATLADAAAIIASLDTNPPPSPPPPVPARGGTLASSTNAGAAPTTMTGIVAAIERRDTPPVVAAAATTTRSPLRPVVPHKWQPDHDRAIIMAAHETGDSIETWRRLARESTAVGGATARDVEERFRFLREHAKSQPCATARSYHRRAGPRTGSQ